MKLHTLQLPIALFIFCALNFQGCSNESVDPLGNVPDGTMRMVVKGVTYDFTDITAELVQQNVDFELLIIHASLIEQNSGTTTFINISDDTEIESKKYPFYDENLVVANTSGFSFYTYRAVNNPGGFDLSSTQDLEGDVEITSIDKANNLFSGKISGQVEHDELDASGLPTGIVSTISISGAFSNIPFQVL